MQETPSDGAATCPAKHLVSLVAICRAEHRYMDEWVSHHLALGVDHLYVYDNEPDGSHRELLAKYGDRVTWTHWTDAIAQAWFESLPSDVQQEPGFRVSRQTLAYTHCLRHFGDATRWLQLLDLDEFLMPQHGDSLSDVYAAFDPDVISRLQVQRYDFGADGRIFRPRTGCREAYTRRSSEPATHKEAGNGAKVVGVCSPHSFRGGSPVIPDSVVIFHYLFKSYAEWVSRCRIGGGHGRGPRAKAQARMFGATRRFLGRNGRPIVMQAAVFLAILDVLMLATLPSVSWLWWLAHAPLVAAGGFLVATDRFPVRDTRAAAIARRFANWRPEAAAA